jgi:hypothetical protein
MDVSKAEEDGRTNAHPISMNRHPRFYTSTANVSLFESIQTLLNDRNYVPY